MPLILFSLLAGGLAANPGVHVTVAPTTVAPTTVAPGNNSSGDDVLGKLKGHLANVGSTASAAAGALDHFTDINATGANFTSVWGLIIGIMDGELHNRGKGQQMTLSGISLVLGTVMLWDGLHVFEIYILLVTFFVVFVLMMGDFQMPQYAQHFGRGTQLWQKILSLEVAVLMSFTFKFSMGFVKKCLGLGLGVSAFLWLQSSLAGTAEVHEWDTLDAIATSPAFIVVLAVACLPTGVWLFSEGPSYVFAIVAPFFGAIMVASAILFYITTALPSDVGSEQPAWIDFVYFSVGTGNVTDIGPLDGKALNVSYNRWVLCTLALVLFIGFGRRQFLMVQEEHSKKDQPTVCDKVMGCFQDNFGACKGSRYYEPLLEKRNARIRELEEEIKKVKAAHP